MTIDRTQFFSRERALSTDQNRQAFLMSRAISEAAAAGAAGLSRESGVFGETSFLVTPQNGTMISAIAPGLALIYDSTKVFPDSTMVWVESRQIREVTHEAADALARYDVIEMRAGSQTSSTQARDIFDPLTGTFTLANLAKELQSWPEFQIRKGAAGASPKLPAGVAGWMPLAYVLIPGNAVAVDSTKIIYCRPLLGSRQIDREGWTTSVVANLYATEVKGGGINIDADGVVGFLAADLEGRFRGHRHKFRITRTTSLRVTVMTFDGGTLGPPSDTQIYFYAIPAPYPTGYDAHYAAREFWTPDTANTYGTNGGFNDVSFQSGCLIISSAKAPNPLHPSGAPSGTGSFAHELFNVNGSATSLCSSWVYIGSAFWDNTLNNIIRQRWRGSICGSVRKTGADFGPDLPIVAPATYDLSENIAADDVYVLPTHVTHMRIVGSFNVGNNSWIQAVFSDQFETDGGNYPLPIFNGAVDTDAPEAFCGPDFWVHTTSNQEMDVVLADGGTVGDCILYVYEWEDPVIALR